MHKTAQMYKKCAIIKRITLNYVLNYNLFF